MEDQKFGKLSSLDVIRLSVQKELPEGQDIEGFCKRLVTLLKDPHYNLIQHNNMVLLLHLVAPYTVEFHTFSVGTTKEMVSNFKGLAKDLKARGVKKALTYTDDDRFLKIAKMTKLDIKMSKSDKKIGEKTVNAHVFELDL